MNFEYKYEAGEQGVTLAGSGDLMDMVAHIARQAQIIHTRLRSRTAEAAASFRAMLGMLFVEPTSPVWEDGPNVRQGSVCDDGSGAESFFWRPSAERSIGSHRARNASRRCRNTGSIGGAGGRVALECRELFGFAQYGTPLPRCSVRFCLGVRSGLGRMGGGESRTRRK